ncbi:MAG: toxin-antitoxin system YwqK family antitoxin, partial [Chitinophagales bacterium]
MPRLFIFIFLFPVCHLFAQTPQHVFKLPGDDFEKLKYKTENGQQVVDKYEKRLTVQVGNDSVIYVEFFSEGKHWNVYRYLMVENKPDLSGWQKEYNAQGQLHAEKFCETGRRKCKRYRSYTYYPGGQLMSDVSYYGDKAQGLHFYFYANGQLRQCMEFDNNRLMNVLAYYDAVGNPLDTGDFCDGEGLVNIYSMNGKLIQQKVFHNGKVYRV